MTWARRWARSRTGPARKAGCWRAAWPASSPPAGCPTRCCCVPGAQTRIRCWPPTSAPSSCCSGTGPSSPSRRSAHFELAADADREQHADWLGLSAYVYALLRDFEVAERHHAQAVELAPERPFRWVERSTLYELEDRYAEALAGRRAGDGRGPRFTPRGPAERAAADAARAQPGSHRAAAREAAGHRKPAARLPARAARARCRRLRCGARLAHARREARGDRRQGAGRLAGAAPLRRVAAPGRSRPGAGAGARLAQSALQGLRRARRVGPAREPPRAAAGGLRAPAPHDLRPRHAHRHQPLLVQAGRPPRGRRGHLLRRHGPSQRAALGGRARRSSRASSASPGRSPARSSSAACRSR